MSEEEIKLIDGYFNKGWCCNLDEVYNTVMKTVKRNEQLEKENKKIKDNLCTECMRNIEYLLGEQNNGNEMH